MVIIDNKAIITNKDSSYTINKGEVFENKDITFNINDSLFLEDQTFSIRRIFFKQNGC